MGHYIREGGPQLGTLSLQHQAVLDFTDDVIKNVRASDTTLNTLRQFLNDKSVADLIMLIGCYMTITRYLETMGVPPEQAPSDSGSLFKNLEAGKIE